MWVPAGETQAAEAGKGGTRNQNRKMALGLKYCPTVRRGPYVPGYCSGFLELFFCYCWILSDFSLPYSYWVCFGNKKHPAQKPEGQELWVVLGQRRPTAHIISAPPLPANSSRDLPKLHYNTKGACSKLQMPWRRPALQPYYLLIRTRAVQNTVPYICCIV